MDRIENIGKWAAILSFNYHDAIPTLVVFLTQFATVTSSV